MRLYVRHFNLFWVYKKIMSLPARIIGILIGLFMVYLAAIGVLSKVSGQSYVKPSFAVKDDVSRAACLAEGLVQPLDEELNCLFGWLPNDLFFVPKIIDNKTNFQRGVIYATRTASPVLAESAARFGDRDTIPAMLMDASSRDFAYADNVWGMYFLYNSEKKYKAGIEAWRTWAKNVNVNDKKLHTVYNMTTADIVAVLKWAKKTMDYAMGVLNDENIGHFKADDVIYYVKGMSRVVDSVLNALLLCDSSIVDRGGRENVIECLKRLDNIRNFNPWYVFSGTRGSGDSFNPNHIAGLARHVDVVSNRLSDIRVAMEK